MHLAERGYALVFLTAMLAIVGVWSDDAALAGTWQWVALALLLGLTFEGLSMRRLSIESRIETASHALLGRAQAAEFIFHNPSRQRLRIEFAPRLPLGFEPLGATRFVTVPARQWGRDSFSLLPIRLGVQIWGALPARVRGRFGLAWWRRDMALQERTVVAPDTLRAPHRRASGAPTGIRPRRVVGAGSELHQLRTYAPGDPLARVDWKATARARRFITREFTEDQHLDVLIAIDAGRSSRARAGRLDRLGLYSNIAARLAEIVTPNDDRIGLTVYSDRVVAVRPPQRGLAAVTGIRQALEHLDEADCAESNPRAAALRIRRLLHHRALIVLLTDVDDRVTGEELIEAVRFLSPPHLAIVATVRDGDIAALAQRPARNWRDPWIALAVCEHESRVLSRCERLRRLGVPVIVAREELLEQAIFAEYESLRRSRKV